MSMTLSIDRILSGASTLLAEDRRFNLTMRRPPRVTSPLVGEVGLRSNPGEGAASTIEIGVATSHIHGWRCHPHPILR
jgi:hypothetical protein